MRTERPASCAARLPRIVPLRRRLTDTAAVAPHRKRSGAAGALSSLSRIDAMGFGSVFIKPDEVSQRHRIGHVVGFGEWIESQRLFESSYQDGDGERVESGVEQDQVIGQRRQALLVIVSNL